jgi:hypothetical protein
VVEHYDKTNKKRILRRDQPLKACDVDEIFQKTGSLTRTYGGCSWTVRIKDALPLVRTKGVSIKAQV